MCLPATHHFQLSKGSSRARWPLSLRDGTDTVVDFGRLPNVDGVDFRLPCDASFTAGNLRRFARPVDAFVEVRTGAPVFGNRDFVGKIYPRGTKSSDYLRAYAAAFSALELNSTYYHLPTPETVDKWLEATPEGFRFARRSPRP